MDQTLDYQLLYRFNAAKALMNVGKTKFKLKFKMASTDEDERSKHVLMYLSLVCLKTIARLVSLINQAFFTRRLMVKPSSQSDVILLCQKSLDADLATYNSFRLLVDI